MFSGRLCVQRVFRRGGIGQYIRPACRKALIRRSFHASASLAVIRPFLLSDIGEGNCISRRREIDLTKLCRHQGSTDYTMVC